MNAQMVARQLDPTGSLSVALEGERVGLTSGRRGPAFDDLTPYQRRLLSAEAILRSGFEEARQADTGRELTREERRVCAEQAAIAMRRRDPDCYEDDKGDAVGKTVEYFRGRCIDASEDAIREIAMEACSFLRSVEAKR